MGANPSTLRQVDGRLTGVQEYRKGVLYTSLGVFLLTPDSLLIRLIEVELWTLLFWRGLLMSVGLSFFLAARRLSPTELGVRGWLAASA